MWGVHIYMMCILSTYVGVCALNPLMCMVQQLCVYVCVRVTIACHYESQT